MASLRGRMVQQNEVIYDQADFFAPDGFTRVTGLTTASVTVAVFYKNQGQPWSLLNGAGVTEQQVASGAVYFEEVPNNPGFYSVRWRPNALGYWRIVLTYTAGQQIVAQDYDVVQSSVPSAGLSASFIKPL